jgi:hypothetical protein
MQIHQTFTNNFRPSNIKEARDYATTLSTIREIDSFPANVATYNQQPADLDPSKFGVALLGAPLLHEGNDSWVTGTVSLEGTPYGPGRPVAMQVESFVAGRLTQYSYERGQNQEVYRKTMGPDCLKIVRDFEAGTLAVSGEI